MMLLELQLTTLTGCSLLIILNIIKLAKFIMCNISGKLSLISMKLDAPNGIAIPFLLQSYLFRFQWIWWLTLLLPFQYLILWGCCGPCGPGCFYFANIMEKGWLIWDFFNIRIFIWLMQKYLIFNSFFPIL